MGDLDFEDWEEIMQESPDSDNHGYRLAPIRSSDDREFIDHSPWRPKQSLNIDENAKWEDVHPVHPGELHHHGMSAHRGVLHEDEYVDLFVLRTEVEKILGHSWKEIKHCYTAGFKDETFVDLKAELDEKFLQIQESGGNMALLARVLGFSIREDGTCFTMSRAVRRARTKREQDGT